MKTLALTLSAAATAIVMSGCGGGGSSSNGTQVEAPVLESGRFIDSAVQGLQYQCNPSNQSGVTDANGIFSCESGDLISFYLAENYIGSALLQGIITPNSFFPNNEEAAINLAQLLQTLDRDGNPDNGIVIDNTKVARLLNRNINFESDTFDEELELYLQESLINEEAARQHFYNSLLALNGGADAPQEPEMEEDHMPDDLGVDAPETPEEPEAPEMEEDHMPEDLGVESPEDEMDDSASSEAEDEGSSSSGSWRPDLGFDIDDLAPNPDIYERPELDLGALQGASSSDEGSSSSSGFGVYIPEYNPGIDLGDGVSIADGFGTITQLFYQPQQFKSTVATYSAPDSDEMDAACQAEFGADALGADWNQIEQMSQRGVDLEALMISMNMQVDRSSAYIKKDGESEYNSIVGTSLSYKIVYDADYSGILDIDNGITLRGSAHSLAIFQTRNNVACYLPSL